MTLEDGQPSQGHADDARSLRSPDAAAEAAGPAAGAPVHGTPGAPLQPSARVVEVDAGGMPLFRTDPGFSGPPIDLVLRVNYVGGSRQLRRRVAPSSLLPWQEAGGGKLACG